jgi:hypothetical protein
MTLHRLPGKFDVEVVNKELPWPAGVLRPTRAIEKATARLSERRFQRAIAFELS